MRINPLSTSTIIALAIVLSTLSSLRTLGAVTVTFDNLNGGDSGAVVNDYLAGFGITVQGTLTIGDDRTFVFPPPSTPIVQASSGHMFLFGGDGTVNQRSFTLNFNPGVKELSFTRIFETCNDAGSAYPGWQATAFEGTTSLGTVGPGTSTYSIFPPNSIPAQTYTFTGNDITSIRFDSYQNNFAAFGSVFIDDIKIVPEPASLGIVVLGVIGLLLRRRAMGK